MEVTRENNSDRKVEQRMAIAKRLAQLCEEKQLTYKDVAEKTGMPVKSIYRIMHGLAACPNVIVMLNICKALEISVDDFFNTDEFKELL